MAGRETWSAVCGLQNRQWKPNVSGYHGEEKYCHDKPSSDMGGNMSKGPEEVKGNAGLIFNFRMLQIPTNTHPFLMLAFKTLKFSANMHTFLIHMSLQHCSVCFGKRKNKA